MICHLNISLGHMQESLGMKGWHDKAKTRASRGSAPLAMRCEHRAVRDSVQSQENASPVWLLVRLGRFISHTLAPAGIGPGRAGAARRVLAVACG